MESSIQSKSEYLQGLRKRNFFWSYSKVEPGDYPDELVIEHVLVFGEPEDIIALSKYFKYSEIKRVWRTILVPDERLKNMNIWLAHVFFNISQADKYIEKYTKLNSRNAHLRFLAAKN